jgi:Kef-type K+ transport system membrane component KefB
MLKLPFFLILGFALGPTWANIPTPPTEFFYWVAALFMFTAGADISLGKSISAGLKPIIWVTLGAFAVPILIGLLSAPLLGLHELGAWVFSAALAVSALPVIVQILRDTKLLQTPTGAAILSIASLCDILVWALFLFILPIESHGRWVNSHFPILLFFIGAALKWRSLLPPRAYFTISQIHQRLLAPLFFIGIGLHVDLTRSFDFGLILAVTVLATFSKWCGVRVGASIAGIQKDDARVMAAALNARGAMEILLAQLAFTSGLINTTWLTTLIGMALLTSLMAGPWISRIKVLSKQKS